MWSSVKPSHANDNLGDDPVGHTHKFWQPRLGYELSREGARQIAANMTGFFSVLIEWSHAESPVPANDPEDSVSEPTEAKHGR